MIGNKTGFEDSVQHISYDGRHTSSISTLRKDVRTSFCHVPNCHLYRHRGTGATFLKVEHICIALILTKFSLKKMEVKLMITNI